MLLQTHIKYLKPNMLSKSYNVNISWGPCFAMGYVDQASSGT